MRILVVYIEQRKEEMKQHCACERTRRPHILHININLLLHTWINVYMYGTYVHMYCSMYRKLNHKRMACDNECFSTCTERVGGYSKTLNPH